MFWEDSQFVENRAKELLKQILDSENPYYFALKNDDIAQLGPHKEREPSVITIQRRERAQAVRSRLREMLWEHNLGIDMESPGLWRVCSHDAAVLGDWVRRRKRCNALIQCQIDRLDDAIKNNYMLKHPRIFQQILDHCEEVKEMAQNCEPNKRLVRNIRRLEEKIPDYYYQVWQKTG